MAFAMTFKVYSVALGCIVGAVICFLVFVYFFGPDANFRSWTFELSFHGIKQPVTWAFPLFYSLGFGAAAAGCNWLATTVARYRNVEGLLLLEGFVAAKIPLLLLSAVTFIAFRPPNFSLSIPLVAVLVYAFLESVFHVFATVRHIRNGSSNWKSELSDATFLVNATLAAGGLLVGLILFETALRFHNPFTLRIKGDKIVLQTNYKFIIKNKTPGKLEERITVSWNSLGFRGEDPPVDLEKHLSIVVVGGSTTEDSSLSDDKTWVSSMDRELPEKQPEIWVNNAGFMGHTTRAHRLLLDDYLAQLKPDVIVYLIGINDLAKDGLAREGKQIDALERSVRRENNNARQFFDRLADYSEVANLINNIYRRYQASKAGLAPFHLSLEGEIPRSRLIEPQPAEAASILEKLHGALERYGQRVHGLITRSREIGAKPVLVTQPLLIGPGRDPDLGFRLDNIEQNLFDVPVSSLAYWNILERYNDVLRRTGKEFDVPVIDLARQMEKQSSYYIDIMHFSVKGAERVGQLVAAGLCPWLAETFPARLDAEDCPKAP